MPAVEIIELPQAPQQARSGTAQPRPQPRSQPRSPVKVYVATPCFGCQMSCVYLGSLLALQGACMQRGIECSIDFLGNESLVERARNILAARFLKSDATHLLFIDADIGFNPDTVLRLLEADKDVATGVYSKKSFDWNQVKAKLAAGDSEPVRQMGLDFNINIATATATVDDNGLVKVLDAATGFMLIKRGVLERMAEKYKDELHCVNDIQGQPIRDYVALFACMIDPDTRRFLSEDFSFLRRYQAMGGEVWADVQSPLAHVGTNVFHGDIRERLMVSVA